MPGDTTRCAQTSVTWHSTHSPASQEEASSRDQAHPFELSLAGWGTGGSKEIVLLSGQSTFFERGKKKESGSGRFCLGPYRRVRGWWDDEVKFGGFGTTLFRKRFQKGLAISIGIGYNNLKVDYYLTIHDCST